MPAHAERGMDEIDRALADPRAGTDHDSIEALVGQHFAELDHGIDRAHHHRGQRRGIDGQRVPGRGQRDQACASAQRRTRR